MSGERKKVDWFVEAMGLLRQAQERMPEPWASMLTPHLLRVEREHRRKVGQLEASLLHAEAVSDRLAARLNDMDYRPALEASVQRAKSATGDTR